MNRLWKWCGLAICGIGLMVGLDRMNRVTAAEDRPAYERSGDTTDRLDRISMQLERLLDRLEARRGPGGPPPNRPGHEPGDWGGMPRGPHPELPPEVRERMQQAREEMKERMEKAREKFRELEDRVKTLEAEVERLKAGPAS